MVDPIIGGGAAVAAVGAAAYGILRRRRSDSDVETNSTVVRGFECNDDAEDPAYQEVSREEIEPQTDDEDDYKREEPPEDPTPEVVTEKDGLTDVKGIGATRAAKLGKAGYPNPEDIYYASDENLADVDGIGEYTVEQIREDVGSVDDDPSGESTEEADSTSEDFTDQESTSQESSSDEQTTSNSEENEDTQ